MISQRLFCTDIVAIIIINFMCTGEVVLPLSTIDLAADDITLWRDIKEPPKGDVLGDLCLSLRYKPQRYVLLFYY
jgi:hypothetical protein